MQRRFLLRLCVPSGGEGGGILLGSARYVDGINVGGKGRNKEAKARRRKKGRRGAGRENTTGGGERDGSQSLRGTGIDERTTMHQVNKERHATRGPSQGDRRTKHPRRKDFGSTASQ